MPEVTESTASAEHHTGCATRRGPHIGAAVSVLPPHRWRRGRPRPEPPPGHEHGRSGGLGHWHWNGQLLGSAALTRSTGAVPRHDNAARVLSRGCAQGRPPADPALASLHGHAQT